MYVCVCACDIFVSVAVVAVAVAVVVAVAFLVIVAVRLSYLPNLFDGVNVIKLRISVIRIFFHFSVFLHSISML